MRSIGAVSARPKVIELTWCDMLSLCGWNEWLFERLAGHPPSTHEPRLGAFEYGYVLMHEGELFSYAELSRVDARVVWARPLLRVPS